MTAVAYFASRTAQLVVVEKAAVPIYEGGRQVGSDPGKYHRFEDHRCKVEGQTSIDFMREREKAYDGPGVWEIGVNEAVPVIELLSELATAKRERVEEFLADEQAGPDRPEVVRVCEEILDQRADPVAEATAP